MNAESSDSRRLLELVHYNHHITLAFPSTINYWIRPLNKNLQQGTGKTQRNGRECGGRFGRDGWGWGLVWVCNGRRSPCCGGTGAAGLTDCKIYLEMAGLHPPFAAWVGCFAAVAGTNEHKVRLNQMERR